MYCNISSSTTVTSQKHLLQQQKKSQHSKIICCNISKQPLQHRRNNNKKGMQRVSGPSPLSSMKPYPLSCPYEEGGSDPEEDEKCLDPRKE